MPAVFVSDRVLEETIAEIIVADMRISLGIESE
jgi:hypothetical protein